MEYKIPSKSLILSENTVNSRIGILRLGTDVGMVRV
jgi:hypothetical protein